MSTPLLTGCTDTDSKGKACTGRLSWTKAPHWRGRCGKCSLTTRATTFEAAGLDERAEAGRG